MNENDQDIEALEATAEAPPAAPELQTIEVWADRLGTPAWLFAAAKIGHGWPIGRELTEAAYLEALDASANVVCR